MNIKFRWLGSSALGLLASTAGLARADSVTLPSGLMGAQIQVFSSPIGWGANHVFAVVVDGPYANYVLENTSAFGGPHLGQGTDYDTYDDWKANSYIGTFTITNLTVANGYDLATNNCSDLMMQVTQSNNGAFYPGVNSLTWPYWVPPAGQEVPLNNTPAGQAVMNNLMSDADITWTGYYAYSEDPGYGGGGESDFYGSAQEDCDEYCS
jgi:hypothetical protein